jgi:hypothetical protein
MAEYGCNGRRSGHSSASQRGGPLPGHSNARSRYLLPTRGTRMPPERQANSIFGIRVACGMETGQLGSVRVPSKGAVDLSGAFECPAEVEMKPREAFECPGEVRPSSLRHSSAPARGVGRPVEAVESLATVGPVAPGHAGQQSGLVSRRPGLISATVSCRSPCERHGGSWMTGGGRRRNPARVCSCRRS